MIPWTREHSYYMAKCMDYHIAYEIGTYWEAHVKRLQLLYKLYDQYTLLHNNYETTLNK